MAAQIAHDLPQSPGEETQITARSVAPPPCHLTILILVHCMAIEIPCDQCHGLFNSLCYLHKQGQIGFFTEPWRSITASIIFLSRSVCNLHLSSWLCGFICTCHLFIYTVMLFLPLYCYFLCLETICLQIASPDLDPFSTLTSLTLACGVTWLLDVGLVPGAGLVLGEAWKWAEPQVSWIVSELGARPGGKHGPGCRPE